MSIFNKIFHSDDKIEVNNNDSLNIADFDDIPNAPQMTPSLEERRKFDEMVKKGYEFIRRSDVVFIDENGKKVYI